jgi:hypothetical protein
MSVLCGTALSVRTRSEFTLAALSDRVNVRPKAILIGTPKNPELVLNLALIIGHEPLAFSNM